MTIQLRAGCFVLKIKIFSLGFFLLSVKAGAICYITGNLEYQTKKENTKKYFLLQDTPINVDSDDSYYLWRERGKYYFTTLSPRGGGYKREMLLEKNIHCTVDDLKYILLKMHHDKKINKMRLYTLANIKDEVFLKRDKSMLTCSEEYNEIITTLLKEAEKYGITIEINDCKNYSRYERLHFK